MHRFLCSDNRNSDSYYSSVSVEEMEEETKWPRWKRYLLIAGIVLLTIAFLLFLLIWVVFPIVFMLTISIQRFFMFLPIQDPDNPQFHNPAQYGIERVVNFYITTVDLDKTTLVSIGAWMILHENETHSNITHTVETAADVLQKTDKPILFLLHGVGCNRIKPIESYKRLRKQFLIVSVDHRGYGDSGSNVDMTEDGIVSDSVQIYQWIRSFTKNEIYIWGHSLGGALTLHTVRKLGEQNIVPMGVVIESSFSTMREEVQSTKLAKVFKWLAYFSACFLDPLEKNGFRFQSTTNILYVNSPLLMMHAQDDNVIPYRLGVKLAEVAQKERDLSTQGNVTFHLFPAVGYQHNDVTKDPKMYEIIWTFLQTSREQNKMKN